MYLTKYIKIAHPDELPRLVPGIHAMCPDLRAIVIGVDHEDGSFFVMVYNTKEKPTVFDITNNTGSCTPSIFDTDADLAAKAIAAFNDEHDTSEDKWEYLLAEYEFAEDRWARWINA